MPKDAEIKQKALNKINQQISKNSPQAKIVAVTKTLSIKAANSAISNNIFIIGENKVQETEKKFYNYKNRKKIELHLIGHLQSNKAKKAVKIFDVIETADSEKIIKKINEEAGKITKKQKIFLQINIGKDKNKYGFHENQINSLCKNIATYTNIEIIGLMTILPQKVSNKKSKELYQRLRAAQEEIKNKHFKTCRFTSMGMSADYAEALECRATHIRIGTLLFGKRKPRGITIITSAIKKERKEGFVNNKKTYTYKSDKQLINKLINIKKNTPITIVDTTYHKNKKEKEEIAVKDHINKTGKNPLRKKQKELNITFIDLTKTYNKTKKGVVTTSLGLKYSKEKQKEKNPSTHLSNIAIICKAMEFNHITAKLINEKKN